MFDWILACHIYFFFWNSLEIVNLKCWGKGTLQKKVESQGMTVWDQTSFPICKNYPHW